MWQNVANISMSKSLARSGESRSRRSSPGFHLIAMPDARFHLIDSVISPVLYSRPSTSHQAWNGFHPTVMPADHASMHSPDISSSIRFHRSILPGSVGSHEIVTSAGSCHQGGMITPSLHRPNRYTSLQGSSGPRQASHSRERCYRTGLSHLPSIHSHAWRYSIHRHLIGCRGARIHESSSNSAASATSSSHRSMRSTSQSSCNGYSRARGLLGGFHLPNLIDGSSIQLSSSPSAPPLLARPTSRPSDLGGDR